MTRRRKKILIIGGSVAVVLLLAVIGLFFFTSLKDSANQAVDEITGQLPGSDMTGRETGEGSSQITPMPRTTSDAPGTLRQNIAVTVAYRRTPSFSLTIEKIEATETQPTIQHYAPARGAPFSLIRVLTEDGRTIIEEEFSIQTEVVLEAPGQPSGVHSLQESTAYIVLPIPVNSKPARIQIAAPLGKVFDEQPIEFTLSSAGSTWLDTIRNWFSVHAQNRRRFTIVVINDIGAESQIPHTTSTTEGILGIPPWSEFADRVDIVPVHNSQDLECEVVTLQTGFQYPICPNAALVHQAIEEQAPDVEWDAAVIAHPHNCQCGTVLNGPITTVGSQPTVGLVVHEFGHSIGRMVDEYFYQSGVASGPLGPNCFPDEGECRDAISEFTGTQCSLGCRTTSYWRPATRIMHNSFSPLEFGPLEECIMGEAIAEVLGEQYNKCDENQEESTPTPTPLTPLPPSTTFYWGWAAP